MNDYYAEFVYETNPFPETHPANLAVLGRLFSLSTAPAAHCRVLEIGCATGGNLLPMAWQLPQSEFIGIDLAANQIALGQQVIDALNLSNIQLQVADIATVSPTTLGQFDYIIAHGVYSWIPAPQRVQLLSLIKACLKPQGLSYLSYNVLPGWRMRASLRDFLLEVTHYYPSAEAKWQQAQRALQSLRRAIQSSPQLSTQYVAAEIDYILTAHPSYVLHEYLAAENHAFLFSQAVDAFKGAGLAYVCDTELHTLFSSTLPAEAQVEVDAIDDPLAQEQWMDFVRMRTFRQSVLCHDCALGEREIDLDALQTCAFTANLSLQGQADLTSLRPATYRRVDGSETCVQQPLTKAALNYLFQQHPRRIAFADVLKEASTSVLAVGGAVSAAEEFEFLAELFNLYSYRLVLAHTEADRAMNAANLQTLSQYPCASALARVQAIQGWRAVATKLHLKLALDEFSCFVLPLCDGRHSVEQLVQELTQALSLGHLTLKTTTQPTAAELTANVQQLLRLLQRHGLLEN